MSASAASEAPASPPAAETRPELRTNPAIGILAVLIGSVISTVAGRLTTFGLSDIKGAMHAGFDEGAWISTAFTVGQMMIGPPTIWLGATFGPRRVLLVAAAIFTCVSILLPLAPSLPIFIALYAISGLASGTFIPLTVSFVLRNLPAQFAVFGVAAYAMNTELSLNISASLEGWYIEHLTWRWIFWQNVILAPLMMLCVWFGIPREPVHQGHLRSVDWPGLLYVGLGLSMLYAALDQGNRLDWLNSGLICGLLLGGLVLLAAFVAHELLSERRSIDLRWLVSGNIKFLALLLIMFRFALLATSLIIPQYLTTVQGYRSLQVGDVLFWIALPQFALAPLVALLLLRVDARVPLAVGFALMGVACYMASGLTRDWATQDFLPSQIIQAIGQSLCFTSLIWFFSKHLYHRDVFTFGVTVQTIRLFGGELGIAFMNTFLRVREQLHSNLIGLHVTSGSAMTEQRLAEYSAQVMSRSLGAGQAESRATGMLSQAVSTQANVLSYIDGFSVIGFAAVVCLVLVALLRDPPAPMAK